MGAAARARAAAASPSPVAEAERLVELGRVAEAVAVLRPLLERDGRHPYACYIMARAALSVGDATQAASLLLEAERRADARLRHKLRLTRGELYARQNRAFEAMADFRAVRDACRHSSPAIAAAALHGVAQLHIRQGQGAEARRALEEASALAPENPAVRLLLADVMAADGDLERALALLQGAVDPEAADPVLFNRIGAVLKKLGRVPEAERAFRIAAELCPSLIAAHINIGTTLYEQRRVAEAAGAFRQALAFEPSNAIARHMLAALGEAASPERASDDYVRSTFDSFADSFEDKLVRQLGYRGPELIEAMLAGLLPPPGASLAVLDAGCGTGLCGRVLRPYASRLDGVDLSPRMLERARGRGVYDSLAASELTRFLAAAPARWDLIAAGDVLVYFGDLVPLFGAAAGALRPGGALVVSVERAEEGWRLGPHGRYAHSEAYLREAAAASGLEMARLEQAVIRHESGKPAHGYVLALRRA